MKSHVSAVFMPFAFALVFSVVAAEGEGWDNIDPARKEREPAKLYWEAPLAKGAAAFEVEKCGGAEGEVSFADGAMTVRKTNERGWIVVRAKERFSVKEGTTLRSFADSDVPDADQFHSVAVLRISGKKDRFFADWTLDAVQPFMSGGPKMGYLSCTAPGRTDRRFASVKATADFGTNVAPFMVVAGAPSTSVWRRWGVKDHDRAHGAWKCHIGRHGGVKGRSSEGIPAEEYLKRLEGDVDHTAKVVAGKGETRLVVDGKVESPVIYKPNHGWPHKWYRTTGSFLSDEGVKLQTAVLDFSQCWGPDGFDPAVTKIMEGAVDQMRRAPDALYILSFNFNVPKEYTAARPDEVWLDSQGRAVYGDHGHCKSWRNGRPPEKCWPWPSMFSHVWRKDAETFISAAVEGLKRLGLAKRVVGFHICGYHDGQFSPYQPDHSAHAVKAFREWMAAERGTQLPADFAPPVFSSDEVFFSDTPDGRLKRDWQTFQHIAPLRVQEDFARLLKTAFGKEVVALHWSMDVLGGSRNGAYYLGEFMKSDVMDGLVAQPSYVQRLPSLALGEGIPSASFAHNGKLYVDEFDLRSYGLIAGYVKEPGAYGLGHARDFAEWQSIHHRIAGVSMARRQAWWYYEISGGFFEPPEIAADIGDVARLRGELARAKDTSPWRPSAALVIDEEGWLARNLMIDSPPDARRLLNSHQLAAAGVPYDVWLADDFMKEPDLAAPYRVVLLEGFHDLTEDRAAFVRRLLAGGRTVVLFAGTGAAGGAERLGLKTIYRKPQVDHEVESLTGDTAEFRSAFYSDWLRWSLGITGGPIAANWRSACFSFEMTPGFKPIARYVADGATAAVEGTVDGGMLVALGEAGGLTPEFFNRLAREAGGYVPVVGGGKMQVDMNGNFVSLHALKTGHFDFRLPFPCKVVNLKTDKPVATSDGTLPLDLVAGETRWYSLKSENGNDK